MSQYVLQREDTLIRTVGVGGKRVRNRVPRFLTVCNSGSAAVQGCSAAVQGCSATVQGYSVAVNGFSADIQGDLPAVQGCSAAVKGCLCPTQSEGCEGW